MQDKEKLKSRGSARRGRVVRSSAAILNSEHMRYLGTLGLLCECAVYVPDDVRDQIDRALNDACYANPHLKWR
jgi:hypothetical protein